MGRSGSGRRYERIRPRGAVRLWLLRKVDAGGQVATSAVGRMITRSYGDGRIDPARPSPKPPLLFRMLPHLPWPTFQRLPWTRVPVGPWPSVVSSPPEELLTQPGIDREPAIEDKWASEAPLHAFYATHSDSLIHLVPNMMVSLLGVAPPLLRATRRLVKERDDLPAVVPKADEPSALTAEVKAKATELGFSAVGVAPYDARYTLAEHIGRNVGDRVIVCIAEQNYASTQCLPSMRTQQAALAAEGQSEIWISDLAVWLRSRGYRARPESLTGESIFIHYAVQAGLGQLGLNGQLLSPHAGSRCRLIVMTTDAPLEFDQPLDYGIEGVCDRCKICVRRCPVGAIPAERREYRGVVKAKLNSKLCLPIVARTNGCAICMKVCPIQRYGLDAVLDEYKRSGNILGKGTDDLEGYDWPIDGRHYGPGNRPRLSRETSLPDLPFDKARTAPLPGLRDLTSEIFDDGWRNGES